MIGSSLSNGLGLTWFSKPAHQSSMLLSFDPPFRADAISALAEDVGPYGHWDEKDTQPTPSAQVDKRRLRAVPKRIYEMVPRTPIPGATASYIPLAACYGCREQVHRRTCQEGR
jgi:hypothetical protein